MSKDQVDKATALVEDCISSRPVKLFLVLAANQHDYADWLSKNRFNYVSKDYSTIFHLLTSKADLLGFSGREFTLIVLPNSGAYSPVFDPGVRVKSDGGLVSLPQISKSGFDGLGEK